MSNINALAGLLDLFTAQGRRGRGLLTDGGVREVRTKAPVIIGTMPPIQFVRPSESRPGAETPTSVVDRTADTVFLQILHALISNPEQTQVTVREVTEPTVLPPEPPIRRRIKLEVDHNGECRPEPKLDASQAEVPAWYREVEKSCATGQCTAHHQSGAPSTKPPQAAKLKL